MPNYICKNCCKNCKNYEMTMDTIGINSDYFKEGLACKIGIKKSDIVTYEFHEGCLVWYIKIKEIKIQYVPYQYFRPTDSLGVHFIPEISLLDGTMRLIDTMEEHLENIAAIFKQKFYKHNINLKKEVN